MTFIDMDPEGMARAMDGLEAAGTGFGDAWKGATAIGDAAGGLGKGPMGQAFMAGYRPAAQRLTHAGEGVSRGLAQAAEAGRGSAAAYRAADANAAAGLGG